MHVMKSFQAGVVWVAISLFVFAHLCWAEKKIGEKKKETAEIEELVVTATRTERPLGDVPASVSVIDQGTIEKSLCISLKI